MEHLLKSSLLKLWSQESLVYQETFERRLHSLNFGSQDDTHDHDTEYWEYFIIFVIMKRV